MATDSPTASGSENEGLLQALVELTSGTTLLKAGRNVSCMYMVSTALLLMVFPISQLIIFQGRSHFRRFSLTPDLTRLTWESAKRTDATVLISEISELVIGQKTPNFKKNPLPECEVCTVVCHSYISLLIRIRTRRRPPTRTRTPHTHTHTCMYTLHIALHTHTHTHTHSLGPSPSSTLAALWTLSAKTRRSLRHGQQGYRHS